MSDINAVTDLKAARAFGSDAMHTASMVADWHAPSSDLVDRRLVAETTRSLYEATMSASAAMGRFLVAGRVDDARMAEAVVANYGLASEQVYDYVLTTRDDQAFAGRNVRQAVRDANASVDALISRVATPASRANRAPGGLGAFAAATGAIFGITVLGLVAARLSSE